MVIFLGADKAEQGRIAKGPGDLKQRNPFRSLDASQRHDFLFSGE